MIIKSENCRGGNSAFSLIEVMMAVVMVAIIFTALFTGLAQGFSLSSAATERLRANQIALERIEGIRLIKWSDLNNTSLVPTNFTASYYPVAGGGQSDGVSYTGTVRITNPNLGTYYNDSIRKVTVMVNWVAGSIARSQTLTTYVSRNGMQNYVYYN